MNIFYTYAGKDWHNALQAITTRPSDWIWQESRGRYFKIWASYGVKDTLSAIKYTLRSI